LQGVLAKSGRQISFGAAHFPTLSRCRGRQGRCRGR
jgi:hypothetical protein